MGGRYTHKVNEESRLYAGLAWQYEFGGKAEAIVNSENAPAPTLKGHSGMLELGWQAELGKRLALDLNVSGWTGKQQGIISGLNLQWKF